MDANDLRAIAAVLFACIILFGMIGALYFTRDPKPDLDDGDDNGHWMEDTP